MHPGRNATGVTDPHRWAITGAAWLLCLLPHGVPAQSLSFGTIRPFVTGIIPVIGGNGAIGGVSVDAMGVVAHAQPDRLGQLAQTLRAAQAAVPDDLADSTQLRKVSLRRIEESIAAMFAGGPPISEAVQYLGGLTRIRYILVYPDDHDIVLAGPAEAWRVDENGNVIGVESGQPVMQLEDLLVALRSVESARLDGISCSINPTEEGMRKLRSYLQRPHRFSPAVVDAMQRILGPQTVTITGVPATSRFARILVASDYHMKRIAMKLDESPVEGLSSYLDLIQSARAVEPNMTPRWWLACSYDSLVHSDDRLAWELRGSRVVTMTESDFLAEDGRALPTGQINPLAKQWAGQMTASYEKLATKQPVFAELTNLMDLSVLAALIAKENLLARCDCPLPYLTRPDSPLAVGQWNAPKTVDTQCSFVKKGPAWIITASGGVRIDSWRLVRRTSAAPSLATARMAATASRTAAWHWD